MEIHFYGHKLPYFEFSNFYVAPITIDGKSYATTEHYFQSRKFVDNSISEQVRRCLTPSQAAAMGRDRNLPLRTDWECIKENVMRTALEAKFTQHMELRNLLLSTGNRKLMEWTPNDTYWACHTYGGKNRLGVLLMELREKLSSQ